MQTEPRLPELVLNTTQASEADRLDVVLARLETTGYRVDREKWGRFEKAHLVEPVMPTARGEREAIKRLRRLLDVERRLAPTGDMDTLCFHLAAAGIDSVPASAVARHIIRSVRSLLLIGSAVAEEAFVRPDAVAAPDAERRAAGVLARRCLADYSIADRSEKRATRTVLAAAFIAYLRSVVRSARPANVLHETSRLVSLDDVAEIRTPTRRGEALPPLASGEAVFEWLSDRMATAERDVLRAVQTVAAMLRLYVRSYPELQIAWRDLAAEHGSSASRALAALSAAPAVLAAAFLQAGELPKEPAIDRALEHLMHQWGASLQRPARFELANGAFPWVSK